LCGTIREHKCHKFFIGIPFDVELGGYRRGQLRNITVAYVALIRSRVNRNALRSKLLAIESDF
jgi:hypothetical protein